MDYDQMLAQAEAVLESWATKIEAILAKFAKEKQLFIFRDNVCERQHGRIGRPKAGRVYYYWLMRYRLMWLTVSISPAFEVRVELPGDRAIEIAGDFEKNLFDRLAETQT